MSLPTLDLNNTGLKTHDAWAIINAITWDNRRACSAGVTATGTNQATAYQLQNAPCFLEVTSAASGTGVCLDISTQGDRITIANNGGNTITIYTAPLETQFNPNAANKINGTAGTTGVTLANGSSAVFFCATPGQWYRISGS